MTSPSKRKGNTYEKEIVDYAITKGFISKRAWGSDGRSLGFEPEVDLVIDDMKIQAKRRKSIAKFLQIPKSCDAVVFRQDRGKSLVLITLDEYLRLLKCSNTNK